mmetsp:Transcript_54637/g.111565  ORF Transcript_54637/g.111565 Transcript_54637/m.111565 type:complete len:338 (-) Transcript_54637:502-1515(-)
MADQPQEEDTRTSEEKIAYLRSRGVKIETPEDRLKGATDFGSGAAVPDGATPITFTYVKIPADSSLPFEEVTGQGYEARDCMLTLAKPYFAGGNVDAGAAAAAARKHMGTEAQLGDKGLSVLGNAAAEGTVEVFALVRPAKSNAFCGVYIYLDEVGLLKKLAPNARAGSIAAACGFNEALFYGDVFVSRTQTLPSPMRNVDFTAAELASDAPWIQRAAAENYDYGLGMREVRDAIEEKRVVPSHAGVDKDSEGEGFKWSQSEEDLEVKVEVPPGTKSKECKVKVTAQQLDVTVPGKDTLVIKLHAKVNAEESCWSVSKDSLAIMMEKCEEGLWPGIH